jgi:pimeloyl-ACP methyl ester carboxylesterase
MNDPRAGGTRFAVRNNVRVAYDPGPAPDTGSDGHALVLLHDLLADRSSFAPLGELLRDGRRVVAPDARGHGASATLANQWYTVAELALDVLAIMDAEEIDAAHLVGHGLGGVTAFELARRQPERIATLTLIEPALHAILDNDLDSRVVSLRNDLRTSDRAAGDAAYKGLVDKALDTYLGPRWGSGWRAQTPRPRLGAIRRHAAALAGIAPALDAYTIAKNELRSFLVPVLLITGVDAQSVDRYVAIRLVERLPVARHLELPLANRAENPLGGDAAKPIATAIEEHAAG